jgi:hypothetical protein
VNKIFPKKIIALDKLRRCGLEIAQNTSNRKGKPFKETDTDMTLRTGNWSTYFSFYFYFYGPGLPGVR